MWRMRFSTLAVSAILLATLTPTHATATFPGSNGWISFFDSRGPGTVVVAMHPDGSHLHRVQGTRGSYAGTPAWSPAGNRLAVSIRTDDCCHPLHIHVLRPWTGD